MPWTIQRRWYWPCSLSRVSSTLTPSGSSPHSWRYSAITRMAVSWMSLNLTPGLTASMAACCAAYTAS